MKNLKARRGIILVTLILSVTSIVLMGDILDLCPGINNITCEAQIGGYGVLMFPFVFIFLLSLLGYFLTPKLYKIWLISTIIWTVLTVWVISLGTGGGGLGVVDYGGFFIVVLLGLYMVTAVPFVLISYLVAYLKARSAKPV